MCNILKTADRKAKKVKIVTRGHRNSIFRVLFMSNSLRSIWGHSVYFANFRCYDFQKSTALTVFIRFQPNFLQKECHRGGGGGTGYYILWRSAKF